MVAVSFRPVEAPVSTPKKRSRQDIYVCLLLLALTGLQLALSGRTSEFVYDSYYYELARSLLARAGYGFNFRPEPMVPPGFPALLAVLILAFGHSYAILIRSMSIFATSGLVTAYHILKADEGPGIAGALCLLLASSPIWFEFSTRMLFSDMPFFFTSMLLLWALTRLDSSTTRAWTQAGWWTLCAVLLPTSILLRSTGIALASGIFGWLVIASVRERRLAKRRLAMYLPLIILGLGAEAAWLSWSERHPVSLWPVHGFQESYVAQLKLKNGNYPELGMATWRDVLKRPLENEDDMVTSIAGLLAHKQIAPAWYSPATVIPLALMLIGLAFSFRKTGGGIAEWYFVSYQLLFLFWPWDFELRFQLPIAPLAALYLWRGGRLSWRWVQRTPRAAGTIGGIVAAFGILSSSVWGWRILHPRPLICVGMWLLAGCLSAVILAGGPELMRKLSLLSDRVVSVGRVRLSGVEIAGAVPMTCLLATGIWMQTAAGVENLRRLPEMNPNIEAAKWIRGHSAPDAVVMARWEALVYHYSGHRVIWFPASTDPELLMAGIRRHHIRLVVVSEDEDNSYWKPSDSYCFQVLAYAYPMSFQQVHMGAHERVYELRDETQPVDGPSW
jgi:hypothetical protein